MKTIAKALIFDVTGQVLLLRRSLTHSRFAHHFDLPGGEVEEAESAYSALKREILEETGLRISSEAVQLVYKRQVSKELRHLLFTLYLQESHPIVLSWEHDQFRWLSKTQLFDLPIPQNADVFCETVLRYFVTSESMIDSQTR